MRCGLITVHCMQSNSVFYINMKGVLTSLLDFQRVLKNTGTSLEGP